MINPFFNFVLNIQFSLRFEMNSNLTLVIKRSIITTIVQINFQYLSPSMVFFKYIIK